MNGENVPEGGDRITAELRLFTRQKPHGDPDDRETDNRQVCKLKSERVKRTSLTVSARLIYCSGANVLFSRLVL